MLLLKRVLEPILVMLLLRHLSISLSEPFRIEQLSHRDRRRFSLSISVNKPLVTCVFVVYVFRYLSGILLISLKLFLPEETKIFFRGYYFRLIVL